MTNRTVNNFLYKNFQGKNAGGERGDYIRIYMNKSVTVNLKAGTVMEESCQRQT